MMNRTAGVVALGARESNHLRKCDRCKDAFAKFFWPTIPTGDMKIVWVCKKCFEAERAIETKKAFNKIWEDKRKNENI